MLGIEDLHVSYGRTTVLRGVSLSVAAGEMVCVVGPNGAGKSTLLRTVSGLKRQRSGRIVFDGVNLAGAKPENIARMGLTMVPEGRHVFQTLTVEENLKVAADIHHEHRRDDVRRTLEIFPVLKERLPMRAGNLSGGEQQQLALARALVMGPRMITVDEPSLGLGPLIVDAVYDRLKRLRDEGMTLLIVEQSTARVLSVADRVYVMNGGRIVASGSPTDFREGTLLEDAYFGRVSS